MIKVTWMLAGLMVAGCATTSIDQELNKKLSRETNIRSRGDLNQEATKDIQSDKGLSEKQKSELAQLRDDIHATEDAIWHQSLKLRAVLVKDMLASNYNEPEILLIQKRMRDLEDKRLTMQFEAIDRANKILGHEFEDADMINEQLFDQETRRY